MNIKKIIISICLSFQIVHSSDIQPTTIVEIIHLENIPYTESNNGSTTTEQDFNVEYDYIIENIDLLNFEPKDKENGHQ